VRGARIEPLELSLVEGETESKLWREHVERYHYLGCRVPFGANLRYWVRSRDRELACLLWTSPAWKMEARDSWIEWSDEGRQRNLQGIVNNGRFLILPWVRVKGLASKILSLNAGNCGAIGKPDMASSAAIGNDGGCQSVSRNLLMKLAGYWRQGRSHAGENPLLERIAPNRQQQSNPLLISEVPPLI